MPLPRIAKGRRPEFYEDPAIDQLFAIVTALTGEISVLFDRLDTVERLLADARVFPREAIEAYVPDGAAAAVRVERRDELLRRVFAVVEVYTARKHPESNHAARKHLVNNHAAGNHAARKNAARKNAARKNAARKHAARKHAARKHAAHAARKPSPRKSAARKAAPAP